jgi:hypothetical protein
MLVDISTSRSPMGPDQRVVTNRAAADATRLPSRSRSRDCHPHRGAPALRTPPTFRPSANSIQIRQAQTDMERVPTTLGSSSCFSNHSSS